MKNISKIITCILLLNFCGIYAQQHNFYKKMLKQTINYFPTPQQSISVFDQPDSKFITLMSTMSFYKIELLDSITNKVIYTVDSNGKRATILKSKLKKGIYILQVYSKHLIINADLYIANRNSSIKGVV